MTLLWLVLYAAIAGDSTPPPFDVAGQGCAMAHCNVRMTDAERMTPPLSSATQVLFQDPNPQGSGRGLGCSSNGTVVACTYSNTDLSLPNLVVYDGDGNEIFDSGTLLDSKAACSVALIDAAGDIIAADDHIVVRYDSAGNIVWQTPTPGGTPISPVTTANGTVVLATKDGPISIYSSDTGRLLGNLYPHDQGATSYYDTVNTPCVIDDRVYVSMSQLNDPLNTGRLYAFEVDPNNTSTPISTAWYFTFGGPSGASPLCVNNVIFFDGDHLSPGTGSPTIFGVADRGAHPELLWSRAIASKILANMPLDPRGGLWYFCAGGAQLVRLELTTGTVLQTIYTADMLGAGAQMVPASAISIATDSGGSPLMILSLQASPQGSGGSYVVSLDITSGAVNWSVMVSPDDSTDRAEGQFPIVTGSGGYPRVVFSTWYHGAFFVGEPGT